MLNSTDFNGVLKDQDNYLLMYKESIVLDWSIDECVIPISDPNLIENYPFHFTGDREIEYVIDPLLVSNQFEQSPNSVIVDLMNANRVDNVFEFFNCDCETFSKYLLRYTKGLGLEFDNLVIDFYVDEVGQTYIRMNLYCYLWYPYIDGPKVLESDANCFYLNLCYSAVFTKKQIGTSLRLGDRIGFKMSHVLIDEQYRDNSNQPYYCGDDFAHLFENHSYTKHTMYVLEVVMNVLYVVRVEPNKYLLQPFKQKGIREWGERLSRRIVRLFA